MILQAEPSEAERGQIAPPPGLLWMLPFQAFEQLTQAWVEGACTALRANRWPLSGNVSECISAWGEAVGQFGFLNVNLAGARDPLLERTITQSYSYGRQLGRMLDVLAPLVEANEALIEKKTGPGAVAAFKAMVEEIDSLKRWRGSQRPR